MDQATEFSQVIKCSKCTQVTSCKLLRDDDENVPQPGFVGSNYWLRRIVLAGQNPGICLPRLAERDARYTSALRAVRDCPNGASMDVLGRVLLDFVPDWPVSGKYFPLAECGLHLDDIAYFNVVRCRTVNNSTPSTNLTRNCVEHFDRWLDWLQPRIVVFIGKWAHDMASESAKCRGIPVTFMNRMRSLSTDERKANRNSVVDLVRRVIG